MTQPGDTNELLERALCGDDTARHRLLSPHEERLKTLVRLRLHSRLRGRVDPSDVVQEAFLTVLRQLDEGMQERPVSWFLWLRAVTIHKLKDVHRRHLDAQVRDVGREVSLRGLAEPPADSASLAAGLMGRLTSPSQAAIRAEQRVHLQQALDTLDPVDREVIALRHFEQLSTTEAAAVLGLSRSGVSSRYVRAMRRLHAILAETSSLKGRHPDPEN